MGLSTTCLDHFKASDLDEVPLLFSLYPFLSTDLFWVAKIDLCPLAHSNETIFIQQGNITMYMNNLRANLFMVASVYHHRPDMLCIVAIQGWRSFCGRICSLGCGYLAIALVGISSTTRHCVCPACPARAGVSGYRWRPPPLQHVTIYAMPCYVNKGGVNLTI